MLSKLHDALRLRTSPVIFFGSAGIIIMFVVLTLAFTDPLDSAVSTASDWLLTNMGWFYILGVTAFLVFLIFIALGRFGRVRLGKDGERPQYSDVAWFGMLFAAGIGTILMFWGVAEPISHFGNPPRASLGVEPGTVEAATDAMSFTFYHFTFHTWAIFALPTLAFAYFFTSATYRREFPPCLNRFLARRSTAPSVAPSTLLPSSAPFSVLPSPSAWERYRSMADSPS